MKFEIRAPTNPSYEPRSQTCESESYAISPGPSLQTHIKSKKDARINYSNPSGPRLEPQLERRPAWECMSIATGIRRRRGVRVRLLQKSIGMEHTRAAQQAFSGNSKWARIHANNCFRCESRSRFQTRSSTSELKFEVRHSVARPQSSQTHLLAHQVVLKPAAALTLP